MWFQVKDGKITATLEERPMFTGKDAIMFGDEHPFHLIYDQWLSTFREVKNQGDAIRLLPMGVLPKDGLYRVEAEGEVIKQCRNEDYDEWKDADKFWSNYPFSTRQVIRIKN